ncbi:hypothetical protein THRCLA_23458, partial [Thraustotheca clavata]
MAKTLFIPAQANVNQTDQVLYGHIDSAFNRNKTPLHYAAENGHKDVVSLLISSQANVNQTDQVLYDDIDT